MSVEDAKAALAGLEGKLQDALDRRDKVIVDISKANAASVRDQRARLELPGLNKQAKAIDEEIALLRINITHARRGLELQEAHAEGAKARQAADRGEPVVRNKLFEIVCPDGRKVRHRGASQRGCAAALTEWLHRGRPGIWRG
jgi:hypothetical protein